MQAAFASRDHLSRLGFTLLPDNLNNDRLNPGNLLPVGLVKDNRPGKYNTEWAGLTCSACHTGQMNFQNTSYYVDGGVGLLDLEKVELDLLDALNDTLNNASKLGRFVDDVLGAEHLTQDRERLIEDLADFTADFNSRVERAKPSTDIVYGPGRTDAFTILINEAVCQILPIPTNCRPANSPTKYYQLWGIPSFDWLQSNSLTHQALGRNLGEVIGVHIDAEINADGSISSSADLPALHALEEWIKELKSPQDLWPFGELDQDRITLGETLYIKNCGGCHFLPDGDGRYPKNEDLPDFNKNTGRWDAEGTYVKTRNIPLELIGTDSKLIEGFAGRNANPGPLRPLIEAAGMDFGDQEEIPAGIIMAVIQRGIIQTFLAAAGLDLQAAIEMNDFRNPEVTPELSQLGGYKARPLDGIAYAAPYLHNNSVRTVMDLLKPAHERQAVFNTGTHDYDPVNLGYEDGGYFTFDTSIPGNHNTGHEFGPAKATYTPESDSLENDRLAIIEFLKTLKVTPTRK